MPQEPTYSLSTLHTLSRQSTHIFRVHSPLSASPLIWTGDPDTSGFLSPNDNLGSLSPSSYTEAFSTLPAGWADGVYMRHSMVDHVHEKHRQTCVTLRSTIQERPGTPEDDRSPWISTSRSIGWCIWEVARRLTLGEENVSIAIIKRGGSGEITVDPTGSISKGLGYAQAKAAGMSRSMKETYEVSRMSAGESEEVLVYGRVSAGSIEADLDFTREHTPVPLLKQFFRPWPPLRRDHESSVSGEEVEHKRERWIERLVWDPRGDIYSLAMGKVVARRRQIETSHSVTWGDCARVPIG